jgi:acetyl-CoA carboxylase carboxyl transferase subunit beta
MKGICPSCGIKQDSSAIKAALFCCPDCGYHYSMSPFERIKYLADENTFVRFSENSQQQTDMLFRTNDEVITGFCKIDGKTVILSIASLGFMKNPFSSFGDKISYVLLKGARERIPVIIYAIAPVAHDRENIYSMTQITKTSSAAVEIDKAEVPYFIVLCSPAPDGIAASFAMLADIIIAEPGVNINLGISGLMEKIIQKNTRESSDSLKSPLQRGFVDLVIKRPQQRGALSELLEIHGVSRSWS